MRKDENRKVFNEVNLYPGGTWGVCVFFFRLCLF
jgi:hypothetical protein